MKLLSTIWILLYAWNCHGQQILQDILTAQDIYSTVDLVECCFLLNTAQGMPEETIGYIELLRDDGTLVSRSMYLGDQKTIHGNIELNDQMNTGLYWLKGYTAMSNYLLKPLIIFNTVNPFSDELIFQNSLVSDNNKSLDKPLERYACRDSVQFEIPRIDSVQSWSVRVIPHPMQFAQPFKVLRPEQLKHPYLNKLRLKGNSAGIDEETQLALTSIREHPELWNIQPGDDGTIQKMIPIFWGFEDYYFQENDQPLDEIQIDPFYDEQPIELPAIELPVLDSNQVALWVHQSLIRNAYQDFFEIHSFPFKEKKAESFYGKAEHRYPLNEYIAMSTQDFIFEIIKEVKVNNRNRNPQIMVEDPFSKRYFEEDPLILLDGRIIRDHDKVLSLNSGLLKAIEIVDRPYVILDQLWGGIVHFISYDQEALKLNQASDQHVQLFGLSKPYRINYQIQDQNETLVKVPDFRHCLFYDPWISTETKYIRFRVPDIPGNYIIEWSGYNSKVQNIHRTATHFIVE